VTLQPATVVAVSEIVSARHCTEKKVNGQPCGNPNISWFEGHGWRCPHHLPPGAVWTPRKEQVRKDAYQPPDPPRSPPNEGKIENIEDAKAAIAWAVQELMNGRLIESKARGVIAGAKAYIHAEESTSGRSMAERIERGLRKAGFITDV